MDKTKHNKYKEKLVDVKRKAKNMGIIANAFKSMNKGQYKKIVTPEVLQALAEEGVDVS